MTAEIKDERTARSKPSRKSKTDVKAREGNVGTALRSVYQQTVSESVPPEMLDLLGKLA